MNQERQFWNKLRILVTNRCNYRCPFCHNEGQAKEGASGQMNTEDFRILVGYLQGQNISELHFSGGEPFLHKGIVEMIEYVNRNTNWGIGCATNLSLITDEQIERLAHTRVKFNIQFPYADSHLFQQSTGNGNYGHILNRICQIKQAGIRIGLNAVVQNDDFGHVETLIDFAIRNELPLKLLPQLGLSESSSYKEKIYPMIDKMATECHDKGTGALRWVVEKDDHSTTILYIDSPCFDQDIEECRRFGELRIHPDMSLQPCIMRESRTRLDLSQGRDYVIGQMTELWNDFSHC